MMSSPIAGTVLPAFFGSLAKGDLLSKLHQGQTPRIHRDTLSRAGDGRNPL